MNETLPPNLFIYSFLMNYDLYPQNYLVLLLLVNSEILLAFVLIHSSPENYSN